MTLVDIERLEELRREAIDVGMRPARDGALAPRERLAKLTDPGSFLELGALASSQQPSAAAQTPTDGVITGYAHINGRKAVVIIEDCAVLAKTDRQVAKEKVRRILGKAKLENLPVIYCIDVPQNPSPAFPYVEGLLFGKLAEQKEMPSLDDHPQPFLVGLFGALDVEHAAFMQQADIVIGVDASNSYGAPSKSKADIRCADDQSAIEAIRQLMDLLPRPGYPLGDIKVSASPVENKKHQPEAELQAASQNVLSLILGDDNYLSFVCDGESRLAAGIGRLQGLPLCVVGPGGSDASTLSEDGLETLYRVARLCRRLRMPLILVQNCSGYAVSDERFDAFTDAFSRYQTEVRRIRAPKISLIAGAGHALGSFALGGRELGVHYIAAWPWASIGLADVSSYTPEVLNAQREKDAWLAAGSGIIDTVILPTETRDHLVNIMSFLIHMRDAPAMNSGNRMLRDI